MINMKVNSPHCQLSKFVKMLNNEQGMQHFLFRAIATQISGKCFVKKLVN